MTIPSSVGLSDTLRLHGRPLRLAGTARIYGCGITPYDVTHLGHAATFVWLDTLARVLQHVGLDAEVCRNITDVDDTLTAAAARHGKHYDEFASVHQFYFDRDMAALNVRGPHHQPRAHAYLAQVLRLAAGLLAEDAAYLEAGSVYFRGSEVVARSGLGAGEAHLLSTEFGDTPEDPAKHDPTDVAIWMSSSTGEPSWDSPWGPGRPGWHAECTAMALSVFGPALDIHVGGKDLRFPHHAFQAGIAEAYTGVTPFARRHLHVGTVNIDGAKMAKSAGNLVLVSDLLRDYPRAALRLLLLDRSWHQDWEFAVKDLDAAAGRLDSLYASAGRSNTSETAAQAVTGALLDDLDVPKALAIAIEAGGEAAQSILAILGLLA